MIQPSKVTILEGDVNCFLGHVLCQTDPFLLHYVHNMEYWRHKDSCRGSLSYTLTMTCYDLIVYSHFDSDAAASNNHCNRDK